MENSKAQLLERLKTANNILVTVSANPSVDQLAAAIGLTLMLNKVGKQGTAVFSGKVPSTIEFLQPEKTIEKNTDSLRDFIIALDKSKADKLRYKVEDSHVKIFITPYRTAISEQDLQFSQGDFNVEVVIALGVKDQKDLDAAITAHGRILHDATTISVTNGEPGTVGSIDWDDPKASSLSEMVASIASDLGADSLDGQIATALMTGIVAMTERFRNARTAPSTMSLASTLMAAGANQQLIATKLEQPEEPDDDTFNIDNDSDDTPPEEPSPDDTPDQDPSALEIDHEDAKEESLPELPALDNLQQESGGPEEPEQEGQEVADTQAAQEEESNGIVGGGSLILDPPSLGGKLTANSEPEHLDPPTDPLSAADKKPPILDRQEPLTPSVEPEPPTPDPDPAPDTASIAKEPDDSNTAQSSSLPEPIEPPKPNQAADTHTPDVSGARDAVSDALASIGTSTQQPLPPISALNAQPFDINDQIGSSATPQTGVDQDFFTVPSPEPATPLVPEPVPGPAIMDPGIPTQPPEEPTAVAPAPAFEMPQNLVPPPQPPIDQTAAPDQSPSAPPAVPPPFMPNAPGFDPNLLPPTPEQTNGTPPPTNPAS